MVEHAHAARAGDIGHVRYFYIVQGAELLEFFLVCGFHHDGHALLGFADGEFRGVEAGIFGGHAVQVDVEAGGQFADGYAHAAGAEVVGLLDEAGDLRTAEQALELALLGGVALLHFAAAGLEGRLGVLLGGTGGSADAVTAGAAAQKQDDVSGGGGFAADGRCLHGTYHGANLHALGGVAFGVNFTHVRGGQANLVAVAGIALGGLVGNHALGEFAGDGIGYLGGDVAGTGHAHGLIYVGTARERVTDGTAQAGGCAAERLNLGGVIVGFVLELQEPLFVDSVHVHGDKDAAGVVLFALLQVFQETFGFKVARADGGELHQAEVLFLAPEVLPHPGDEGEGGLDIGLDERLVHLDFLQG